MTMAAKKKAPSSGKGMIVMRVSEEDLARAEGLFARWESAPPARLDYLRRAGRKPTLTDVWREAMLLGMDRLERESTKGGAS